MKATQAARRSVTPDLEQLDRPKEWLGVEGAETAWGS